ncbi:MAG TPA: DUF5615 family PIN-like protein [Candidatus Acidoferrales bacterium]|nr:DUF5615 family PIN-like protein [Candidatus Acidoferrales bacterium]
MKTGDAMEFIVDKNLPPWMVELLAKYNHQAVHVDNCTYNKDKDIVQRAKCLHVVVVTRDIGLKSRVIENLDNKIPAVPIPYPGQTKMEKRQPQPKFAKGILMIGGSPKLTGQELHIAVNNMLNAMKGISFAHAASVDIMIDRDGICFKITEEIWRNRVPKRKMNEVRAINDFDRKMAYFKAECGFDYSAIIEDRETVVDGDIVKQPNHRFFLRRSLNYITERIEIARVAGINIRDETNASNAIKKKPKEFTNWVRRETPPEKQQLVEAMLNATVNHDQAARHTGTNHKPGYVMTSKRNKIPQKRV